MASGPCETVALFQGAFRSTGPHVSRYAQRGDTSQVRQHASSWAVGRPGRDRDASLGQAAPAVNHDSLTGDEAGLVGREKRDRVRDVLRRTEATYRNGRDILGPRAFRHVGMPFDGDEARRNVFTVTPTGANSRAHARLSPIWAFLAAAYADRPGEGR